MPYQDRKCGARQTLARLRPHFHALGITRLGELTGLDDLGIPVAMAVRPNSHSLSVSLGKGPDRDSAMISAAMEAAETAVAEQLPGDLVWASESTLGASATPIARLRSIARCHPHRLSPTETIAWYPCHDISNGDRTLAPWSLLGMDHRRNPPGYHEAFYVASDGLASGNTYFEAVFHGLCELIERDSLARFQFASLDNISRSEVVLTGQEHSQLPALLKLIDAAGLRLRVFKMDSDLPVPAFLVLLEARLLHPDDPSRETVRCGGCGCHPDAGKAIIKAITEAAQARLALVAGARDDIRCEHYDASVSTSIPPRTAKSLTPQLCLARNDNNAPPPAEDLESQVRNLVGQLQALGIDQVLVAELDAHEFDIHVVRVVATELQVPLQGNRVQITQRGLRNIQEVAA
jgi:ribosomal protein S12 methylthiotransferase accessory factor